MLLIESLPDLARQVSSALGRLGLHVEVCHSLPEVARRAAAVRVDGALVGLDLARIEDYALLRQLAYGFSRRLPLWLLATDTPTSADRLACRQHGVDLIELGPSEGRGGSAALPWITQTLALHLRLERAVPAAEAGADAARVGRAVCLAPPDAGELEQWGAWARSAGWHWTARSGAEPGQGEPPDLLLLFDDVRIVGLGAPPQDLAALARNVRIVVVTEVADPARIAAWRTLGVEQVVTRGEIAAGDFERWAGRAVASGQLADAVEERPENRELLDLIGAESSFDAPATSPREASVDESPEVHPEGLAPLEEPAVQAPLERSEPLDSEEQLLSTAVTAAPIVLFSVDRFGNFQLSDGQVLESLGLQPGQMVGESVFDHFGDVPELVANIRRALAGHSFTATVELRGRSLETSFSPVFGEDGHVQSVTGVAIDVTERRLVEERMRLVVEGTQGTLGTGFLRSLARSLSQALDVELAYVAELADADTQRLRLLEAWSANEEDRPPRDGEWTARLESQALATGWCRASGDELAGGALPDWIATTASSSFIAVGLRGASGAQLGLLAVSSRGAFLEQQQVESILQIFASRAGAEIERLRGEEELRRSEERWRSLVANAPDLIVTLDASGSVLFSNRRLSEDEGEHSVFDPVFPEDLDPLRKAVGEVFSGAEAQSFEARIRGRDGRLAWYSGRIAPHERVDGAIASAILVARDITPRKEAEAKLQDRLALEKLVTSISTRFINLDPASEGDSITSALYQICEYAGVDRAFVFQFTEDRTVLERTHAWNAPGLPEFLREVREDEPHALGWIVSRIRDDEEVFIQRLELLDPQDHAVRRQLEAMGTRSLACVPMSCAGELIGFLGFDGVRREVGWDQEVITLLRILGDIFANTLERNRAAVRKAELEEQLRHAQKLEAIGTLAGGIAHDFNNILTSILGHASLLRRESAMPAGERSENAIESVAQAARVIELAAEQGADLTRQLLSLARTGPMETRAVDLHQSIQEVCELSGRTLGKDIELVLDLHAERSVIPGDPGQLLHVFLNLVVNARDAMPEGGEIRFTTRVFQLGAEAAHLYPELLPGEYLEVRVADTGTGIGEADLQRIFEPFFTTKDPGKGTGMGLSQVYGILRNHGGLVRCDSVLGEGTAFRVLLPLGDEPLRPVQDPEVELNLSTGRRHGRILVVDDESLVRTTAAEMLRTLGYEVLLASDGEEGVRFFGEEFDRIDGVLLDLIMPGMDGRACAQALQKIDSDVPIVLCSGWGYEALADDLERGGFAGLVRKPYKLSELARAVEQALGRRALDDESADSEVSGEAERSVEIQPQERRPGTPSQEQPAPEGRPQ
ncbi:MAG: response regulator [Planctomycetota bacterium]